MNIVLLLRGFEAGPQHKDLGSEEVRAVVHATCDTLQHNTLNTHAAALLHLAHISTSAL